MIFLNHKTDASFFIGPNPKPFLSPARSATFANGFFGYYGYDYPIFFFEKLKKKSEKHMDSLSP